LARHRYLRTIRFAVFLNGPVCTHVHGLPIVSDGSKRHRLPKFLSTSVRTLSARSSAISQLDKRCVNKRGIRRLARTWAERFCVPSKHAQRGRPGKTLNSHDIPRSAFTARRSARWTLSLRINSTGYRRLGLRILVSIKFSQFRNFESEWSTSLYVAIRIIYVKNIFQVYVFYNWRGKQSFSYFFNFLLNL